MSLKFYLFCIMVCYSSGNNISKDSIKVVNSIHENNSYLGRNYSIYYLGTEYDHYLTFNQTIYEGSTDEYYHNHDIFHTNNVTYVSHSHVIIKNTDANVGKTSQQPIHINFPYKDKNHTFSYKSNSAICYNINIVKYMCVFYLMMFTYVLFI